MPIFPIYSKNVHIIETPNDFYQEIINGIKQSQYRITMATLYLGSKNMEQKIINELDQAIQMNRNLKINFVMDKFRGQRLTKQKSPLMEFQKIKNNALNPENLCFSFFQHNKLKEKNMVLQQNGFCEIFGVLHLKMFIFDDNVILTGANLEENYFTNRKDRYIKLKNEKNFADYLQDFVEICSDLGEQVQKIIEEDPKMIPQPIKSKDSLKIFKQRIDLFMTQNQLSKQQLEIFEQQIQDFEKGQNVLETKLQGNEIVQNTLKPDCFIIPSFQSGLIQFYQDSQLLINMMKYISSIDPNETDFLCLSSGYFNPSQELSTELQTLPIKLKKLLICCSPHTNSFKNSGYIKSKIPKLYRISLKKFMEKQQNKWQIQEHYSPNVTFHSKGLWYQQTSNKVTQYLSIIGSSNYNFRSTYLDLEGQFWFITNNNSMINIFERERQGMLKDGKDISLQEIKNDKKCKISIFDHFLYKWLRKYFQLILIMIGRVVTYSVAVGSFSYLVYFASNYEKFYQSRLKDKIEQKKDHFKKNNFDLLYSPFAFLYLYQRNNTIESFIEYSELVEFYQPKKIGFDISNEYYLKHYQDYVKTEQFLKDFKEIKNLVKNKNVEQLTKKCQEKQWTSKDLFHLYTFHKCYDQRCLVYFANEEHFKEKIEHQKQLEQVRQNASLPVKKLMKDSSKFVDQDNFELGNKSLVDQLFLYATQKGSFFTEPKKRKYMVIGSEQNIKQIMELWKYKFRMNYDIEIFNIKDESVTVQQERDQLRSLQGIL